MILLTAQCRIVVVGAGMFVEDQNAKYGREGTFSTFCGVAIITDDIIQPAMAV